MNLERSCGVDRYNSMGQSDYSVMLVAPLSQSTDSNAKLSVGSEWGSEQCLCARIDSRN